MSANVPRSIDCSLVLTRHAPQNTHSADKGIGLEFVCQLQKEDYLVVACAKDAQNAKVRLTWGLVHVKPHHIRLIV